LDVVDGRWWFDNQSTRDRMEELGSELIMTVAAPEPGKTGKQKKKITCDKTAANYRRR